MNEQESLNALYRLQSDLERRRQQKIGRLQDLMQATPHQGLPSSLQYQQSFNGSSKQMESEFEFDVGEHALLKRISKAVVIKERKKNYGQYSYVREIWYTICYQKKLPWTRSYKSVTEHVRQEDLEKISEERLNEMSIISRLKNIGMPEDDRLLRKHGLVDDSGDPTSDGKAAMWALLIDQLKPELAERLRKLEAEDQKKKTKKA